MVQDTGHRIIPRKPKTNSVSSFKCSRIFTMQGVSFMFNLKRSLPSWCVISGKNFPLVSAAVLLCVFESLCSPRSLMESSGIHELRGVMIPQRAQRCLKHCFNDSFPQRIIFCTLWMIPLFRAHLRTENLYDFANFLQSVVENSRAKNLFLRDSFRQSQVLCAILQINYAKASIRFHVEQVFIVCMSNCFIRCLVIWCECSFLGEDWFSLSESFGQFEHTGKSSKD